MTETTRQNPWLARPDRSGWWEWMEGGHGEPERLLLSGDGSSVAYDDEWEQATGRNPEHNWYSENYWEGTDTTPELMPGWWRYIGTVAAKGNSK